MRKFIFNSSIIGAIASGFAVIQTTRRGPRDWRLVLMWVSWALTVALAVGSVQQDDREARELNEK
ncbi:hypothetical protein B7R22_03660 [Subtercola boreus]|uniref:NADH:ubiquinone oxidoreductase n=1 Tax=Subtercola boreus TaxID=120213 RepID=A0A3E0W0L7_9MICO|nr:hypothetical protein [Subtercola boreus]MDF2442112.1 hypothetical protein [Subtercola sp.]RFA15289.1 hypothetical protein B7R21_04520 [Subtercola boreus]RFA16578.1 hypothetical protein B7R22_03660 [Subtercola boreus]